DEQIDEGVGPQLCERPAVAEGDVGVSTGAATRPVRPAVPVRPVPVRPSAPVRSRPAPAGGRPRRAGEPSNSGDHDRTTSTWFTFSAAPGSA
ncbi:hypothetical protein C5C27_08730, partial [Rathayibacter sp. AY2B7]